MDPTYSSRELAARTLSESSGEEEVGALIAAKDAALAPVRLAVSKPARRAYLSTALFAATSLFLLAVAAGSYLLFYYSYIPYHGFSRPVYLQYDAGKSPYGIVPIAGDVVSNTPYDIKVTLQMPRTQSNRDAGNFMLNIDILGPDASDAKSIPTNVLVNARRPSIMTYQSNTMEHLHRASGLVWYLLGWKREVENLQVTMLESVQFPRGSKNVPTTARLEIQSEHRLQIYSATMAFTARLKGLRYIMYNYRIASFLVFTGAFWAVATGATAIIWTLLTIFTSGQRSGPSKAQLSAEQSTIKEEIKVESEISDTERTFPSTSRKHPLRYSSPGVKSEEETKPALADIPLAAEADVEDEDEDADFILDDPDSLSRGFVDSGIGTSMESGVESRKGTRKRRSRNDAGR